MKNISFLKSACAVALLVIVLAGGAQAQTNLFLNGSFETNSGTAAPYWSATNNYSLPNPVEFGAATGWSISPAPDGTQVALLPGTNWLYALQSDTVTLEAGKSYRFSYWVRSWSSEPGLGAYVYLQNVGQPTDYDTYVYPASQNWQWYTKVITATGNDTVRFVAWSRGSTYNYTFFDNVVLEEGTYITNVTSSAAVEGVGISWFGTNAVQFNVLATTNLADTVWTNTRGPIIGNGTATNIFDPYNGTAHKFYKVIAIQ